MTGPRTIYVDGYNVIRNTPALSQAERISLADGRAALLASLATRYRHTPHHVVVVFDGAGSAESLQAFPGLARGQVIFSRQDETADAVIIRLAAEARLAGAEVSVISDDSAVRGGARAHGAATARVGDLKRRTDEAPRLLRKRFAQQIALKRKQASEDDDDDATDARRRGKSGNPRRAPRKRGQPHWDPPI